MTEEGGNGGKGTNDGRGGPPLRLASCARTDGTIMETGMAGLLDGIRVLDLSWGIAGPMTTMLLADHGADVIRIESPQGDPFASMPGQTVWGRGKRSAVLDLKDEADRGTFLQIVRTADIVVESFAPGISTRLGIDYASLSELNGQLIHCTITAYGTDNRHAHRPGYDALVAARCGLQWEQRGWPEGALYHAAGRPDPFAELQPDSGELQGAERPGPLFSASHWPSLGACLAATTAISAALFARERTGLGQRVETSLLQGALCAGSYVWQRAENPDAEGLNSWIFGSKSPKGHFRCADSRWIHNWVPNPHFLLSTHAAQETVQRGSIRNDPDRFGMGPEEVFVLMHYQPLLRQAVATHPAQDWVDAAAGAGVPLQIVRSVDEALMDEHLLADGCVAEVEDPHHGRIRHLGIAYEFGSSHGAIRGPAPRAGEHTEAIRREAQHLGTTATDRPCDEPTYNPVETALPPLHGITVLDLGLAIAGPYGTQLLSDLGANVIKVNALHDGYWHACHIAWAANRGKRSIALNLKDPQAKEVLYRLVARADVVHHNMRLEAAERLGIDHDALRRINPRLIYCHTRGFDRGPRESHPGNDQTGACLAGVEFEDGGMADGGKPLWSLTSLGDIGNGCLSAIAVLQALYHRARTGEGQMCSTSIINAALMNTSNAFVRLDGKTVDRPRIDGQQFGFNALCRLYETRDGWLCIVIAREEHWLGLVRSLEPEGLEIDARFADATSRAEHDAALGETLAGVFSKRSAQEWFELLDTAGVPCEISSPTFAQDMYDDPEMQRCGYIATYQHPHAGRLDQVGLLFQLSRTPARVQGRPLIVGENTREILEELGYAPETIDALHECGAILGR